MRKITINGLVKISNSVRDELSKPISQPRLAELESNVSQFVESIKTTLKENRGSAASLAMPSRRAYQFLKTIDFSKIKVSRDCDIDTRRQVNVRFPGLTRFFRTLLTDLACIDVDDAKRGKLFDRIVAASDKIETQMLQDSGQLECLTDSNRKIRGWLSFFSKRANFDDYLSALTRSRTQFNLVLAGQRRFRRPPLIQFKPMEGLYHAKSASEGTHILLPSAFILFDDAQMLNLAKVIFTRNGDKSAVLKATLSESYITLAGKLDNRCELAQKSAGVYSDLADVFERINRDYFASEFEKPRLYWTQTFTHRMFGSYDFATDSLAVSATLDQQHVPEFVLEFIMYHELLHKKHGIRWQNGRKGVHTPAFLRDEKKFKEYHEASEILKTLSR